LPGKAEASRDAVLWFTGQRPSMWTPGDKRHDEVEHSIGADLIQSDALAVETEEQLAAHRRSASRGDQSPDEADRTRQDIKYSEALAARVRQGVKRDQDELWGAWGERQERARQYLRSRGVES
jgi:hypothetical protein